MRKIKVLEFFSACLFPLCSYSVNIQQVIAQQIRFTGDFYTVHNNRVNNTPAFGQTDNFFLVKLPAPGTEIKAELRCQAA